MEKSEWINLFNGRDLTGWKTVRIEDSGSKILETMGWRTAKSVSLNSTNSTHFEIQDGEGILLNGYKGRTSNLYSEFLHGDCELHIEFIVPKNSNSGIYFMGHYEVQVLDSWNETELSYGSCGGIYAQWIDGKDVGGQPPNVNASLPPGKWQRFDIIFRAPKFNKNNHKKTNAFFESVVWNDEIIHENVEVKGPTRASMLGPEQKKGPLMIQGDHGPVAYRNICLREL
jgi:hypothetical protein